MAAAVGFFEIFFGAHAALCKDPLFRRIYFLGGDRQVEPQLADGDVVRLRPDKLFLITIQELLFTRGLNPDARSKLVRHKDNRPDLYNLYRYNKPAFLEYQQLQTNDVFNGVDYIVTFIGIFRIPDKSIRNEQFWYDMEEVSGFDDLKERVIINWGEATLFWHQRIKKPKAIIEIHPGLHYQQFTSSLYAPCWPS